MIILSYPLFQKNIAFQAETKYGNLEITINLSKPEKDPKRDWKTKKYASNKLTQNVCYVMKMLDLLVL